jgi:hypothetical protein
MANVISKSAFFQKIGYEPHEAQLLYHRSQARFRLPNCGRRFGKSTMAGRDLEPKLFLPDKLFWIVGPTYDLGEKEFRVIWHDLIVRQQLGKDKRVKRAYNKKQGNMFIEFPWHTRLEVRSADHPENLVGDALDWVIMSEAAKHKQDTWERFIRPALADKRGGADFPTTPEGYNWLYQLWMHGQDNTLPDYESWRFPSWANPAVYPEGENDPEIKLLRRTMSPESFMQEIGADFGSFVGKIYPEWDVNVHVRNVKFNPAWPNYIAFDWGYTNPLAAVEFQVSPDDRIYIWREHYKAYTRVEDHCAQLRNRDQPEGYHLDMGFGDAADPEAADTVSTLLVPTIAMPEAKTNWREGVDLVRSFMTREEGEDEFGGPIYNPAFFVDFSCANFIREINNYKAPSSTTGKNVQEIGLRQDDHTLDAIRYALVHIFKLGATYTLSDVMAMNKPDMPLVSPTSDLILGNSTSLEDSGAFTMGGVF